MNQKPNRLIHEKSPYLQQHAYQPIDWYPWGDEAFDKAKNEDKLIFLSIGYSTCHWCHVMSRESFADDEVAKLLNDSFVAIKVDREERPDIDQVYMEMAQVMTGRVGWPLTIIMTPDQIPFFATTYLPKEGDGQYYGLIEILTLFHTKWCVKREDIYRSVNQVQEYFRVRSETHYIQNLDQEVLDVAFETLLESFDSRYGGYGSAPKFPMPHYLSFLLRYGLLLDVPEAVHMMDKTLKAMYKGGIYDHLGGGFARYSVDEKWLVPHFEKMCDDNALLAIMYCEAYRHTNHPLYKKIVRDTLKFIERELLSPEGAFYTAIDADSEGEEGKYYVWSQSQLLDSLSDDEYQLFMEYYQLSEFEHSSIINRIHIHDDELSNIPEEIERIEKKLLHVRQTRLYPHRDEKILTRNNGIMIAAFVNAYVTFDEPHYLDIAEKAVSFILNKLCDEDGRLYARYIDGERKFLAYADDYAFLIWGLIDLFLATGKPLYLNHALAFTEDMKKHYYDDENGGFYFSAHDSEKLIFRNKEFFDGAIPSSNAVMAMNYIRLAEIIDHPEYEELAVGILEAFGKEITKSPTSYLYALTAYLYFKIPKRKIVLVTESVNEQTKHLQQIIWKQCVPCTQMITLLKDDIKGSPYFSYYLEDPRPISLHICENYMCNDPIHDYDEMIHALENLYTKTE